jgi:hypothetical protein
MRKVLSLQVSLKSKMTGDWKNSERDKVIKTASEERLLIRLIMPQRVGEFLFQN